MVAYRIQSGKISVKTKNLISESETLKRLRMDLFHQRICRDCARPAFPDGYCYACNNRRHAIMQELGRQRRELRQMERELDENSNRFNRAILFGCLAAIGSAFIIRLF